MKYIAFPWPVNITTLTESLILINSTNILRERQFEDDVIRVKNWNKVLAAETEFRKQQEALHSPPARSAGDVKVQSS